MDPVYPLFGRIAGKLKEKAKRDFAFLSKRQSYALFAGRLPVGLDGMNGCLSQLYLIGTVGIHYL